jgi:hypothetical protein
VLALLTNVVAAPTINWGLRHMEREEGTLGPSPSEEIPDVLGAYSHGRGAAAYPNPLPDP